MREQVGWRGLVRTIRHEAPFWAATLPQLPRLVHRALAEDRLGALHTAIERLADEHARRNRLLSVVLVALVVWLAATLATLFL